MNRYKVGFSLGGYIIVRAATAQEAMDICRPMLAEGESLTSLEQIE